MTPAIEPGKLLSLIRASNRAIDRFRTKRAELLRRICGSHYGDSSVDKRPINLLAMAAEIYARNLVPRRPRALVTSRLPKLQPFARNLQLALNDWLARLPVVEQMRAAVMEALVGLGVIYTGVRWRDPFVAAEASAFPDSPLCPLIQSITLDSLVLDASAPSLAEIAFIGHTVTVPLEWARQHPLFDPAAAQRLQLLTRPSSTTVAASASEIAIPPAARPEFAEPMCQLVDLYLPRWNQRVVTGLDSPDQLLLCDEYDGPPGGPYTFLYFQPVPDNLLPLPPLYGLADLDEAANRLLSREIGRALKRKVVITYASQATRDAEQLRQAEDMYFLRVNHPDLIRQQTLGGVDSVALAMVQQLRALFVYLGGNLDVLGGLSTAAPTLGQDQLLIANASRRLSDMQEAVMDAARAVMAKLAWHRWYDPWADDMVFKLAEGTRYGAWARITPDLRRRLRFEDFQITIDPYSMQPATPASRLNAISGVLNSLVMPALPMLARQGLAVDWRRLLEILQQYTDTPELSEILVWAAPSDIQVPRQPDYVSGKAPVTVRTELRRSEPAPEMGLEAALAAATEEAA